MKYTFILLLFAYTCIGQVQTIRHLKYTTRFDTQKHYAVRVDWWLTRDMLVCPVPYPRAEGFSPDPLSTTVTDINRDYIGSGYDRGHNMSAEDNRCSGRGMAESFYFSNVSPQHPILNRGIWKELEEHIRVQASKDDSLRISSGAFGEITRIKSLTVPAYWWKVIYNKRHKLTTAYLFRNDASTAIGKLEDFRISIPELEQKTGLKFAQ